MGGVDGVRLWDARTGKPLADHLLKDAPRDIRYLTFSRDGKQLAAAGLNITVWDVARRPRTSFLEFGKNKDNFFTQPMIAFRDKGKLVAVGCPWDNEFANDVVIDGTMSKQIYLFKNPMPNCYDGALFVSPDGDRLIRRPREDGKFAILEADTAKPLATITHPQSRLLTFAFSPDHSLLAVNWLGLNGKNDSHPRRCVVKVYETDTGKERWTIPDLPVSPGLMAFGTKGRTLAIEITREPVIQVWELPAK
jgi:WD40 repeat protein